MNNHACPHAAIGIRRDKEGDVYNIINCTHWDAQLNYCPNDKAITELINHY